MKKGRKTPNSFVFLILHQKNAKQKTPPFFWKPISSHLNDQAVQDQKSSFAGRNHPRIKLGMLPVAPPVS